MNMDFLPNFAGMIFRDVVSQGDRSGVYLTFDDGPDPDSTPEIIRILNQTKCPATFFVTGYQAEKHPSIVERIHREGNSIGSHGYHHKSLLFRTANQVLHEIRRTKDVISKITGESTRLFRPPYGRFGLSHLDVVRNQKSKMVLWSLSGLDWKSQESNEIVRRVTKRIKSGDIVLLHDRGQGVRATISALPLVIDGIRSRGFELKKLGGNI
ncbi:MAG: polysaccharide deacetylase family protein [Calditrichaeota bacterium]|nr:polysaccharide deacetylase family protein [Calditrichota bacterium]